MSRLAAHFLGTFTILLDGKAVRGFESMKTRALLVYLLLEAERSHTRAHLATLLWPEQSERRARHNLRQVLSNLRQVLGGKGRASQFLEISRDVVKVNRGDHLYVDVTEFLRCVGAAEENHSDWVRHLERAAELYRGELLPGFTVPDSDLFEDWLRQKRETLYEKATYALRRLSDYYEHAGLYRRAIEYARRLLYMSPWDETSHRRMMRLLALSGQRALALAQYAECKRLLNEEFGTPPSPETEDLYAKIRAGTLRALPEAEVTPSAERVVARGRLPTFVTPFVGREKERLYIRERLNDPRCRLVTITGMGGIGKSRLALEAARECAANFRDGFVFVPLSTVTQAAQVPQAIADALGILAQEGKSIATTVLDYLANRQLILVLDNFEQVTEARDFVLSILEKAPEVKLLITSREPLRLFQEWTLPLTGLAFPPDDRVPDVEHYDAVQLFLKAARRVRPDFVLSDSLLPDVVRICRQVEGSPLAIELATSWLQTLSCHDVAVAIEQDMDILTTPAPEIPERHRSMRVVFDYSWGMLTEEERRAFRRLSIFEGPFTAQAAREVTDVPLPLLGLLVRRSLLSVSEERFYVFHPLLRRYARERLEDRPDEYTEMRERHADFVVRLLTREGQRVHGPEQRRALDTIARAMAEIRAAWQWLLAHRQMEKIAEILLPLYHFFEIRGRWEEGYDLFGEAELACGLPRGPEERCTLARVCMYRGWFALRLSRGRDAGRLLQKARKYMDMCGTLEDQAFLVRAEGVYHKENMDYHRAVALLEESVRLYRKANEPTGAAFSLLYLCNVLDTVGENLSDIRRLAEEALALFRVEGIPRGVAQALFTIGNIYFYEGRYSRAREAWEESLHIRESLGDRLGLAIVLTNLANLALMERKYEEAHRLFQEGANVYNEIGSRLSWAFNIINLGLVEEAQDKLEEAVRYYLLARNTYQQLEYLWGIMTVDCYLADVYVEQNRAEDAARLLREALSIAEESRAEGLLLRVLVSVGHYLLHKRREDIALHMLGFVHSHPRATSELIERVERLITHPTSGEPRFDIAALCHDASHHSMEEMLALARQALGIEQQ